MSHHPKKRFGQNFLRDEEAISRIITAIDPQPDDNMVEIGPGMGALTTQLLPRLHHLHAIELDRDLLSSLRQQCAPLGEITIHNRDVLQFNFAKLFKSEHPLRVVGNLPYNISTPLLFRLLQQQQLLQDMHFMLQLEVVERLAATAEDRNYGRLSVMVQLHCRVEPLFTLGPEAFYPPPKVHSAVVRLTPWEQPPVSIADIERFKQIVSTAFSQRRKTLRNSLKGMVDPQQFEIATIDPSRRPETLTLEEFAALAER